MRLKNVYEKYNEIRIIDYFNVLHSVDSGFNISIWPNLLLEYVLLQMIKVPTRVASKSSYIIYTCRSYKNLYVKS